MLTSYVVYKVDESNSTLLSIGQVVTSFFGTTFEFFNLIESTVLKVGIVYPRIRHI